MSAFGGKPDIGSLSSDAGSWPIPTIRHRYFVTTYLDSSAAWEPSCVNRR